MNAQRLIALAVMLAVALKVGTMTAWGQDSATAKPTAVTGNPTKTASGPGVLGHQSWHRGDRREGPAGARALHRLAH
jgi:hypothetical protein